MSFGKTAKLSGGSEIPLIGFGTWQAEPGQVKKAVIAALKAGYRHLDLAKVYGNQPEVGEGIKEGLEAAGIKRSDVFITSKLWNSQHRPEDVAPALDDCLQELGLDYLDLYLVHFPVTFTKVSGANPNKDLFPLVKGTENADVPDVDIDDSVSIVDTWKAMVALDKSKARAVGTSNHTVKHLEALIKATGKAPEVNQVELHVRLQDDELRDFAKKNNIHLTGYSSFGNNMINEPMLFQIPEVQAMAKEVGATAPQILLAWVTKRGASTIPKSVTESRIQANFEQVDISDELYEKLTAWGKEHSARFNVPVVANKPRWNVNIFDDKQELGAAHKVIV